MYIKKYKKYGKSVYMVQGVIGKDILTGKEVRVTRRGLVSKEECLKVFNELKLEFEKNSYLNIKKDKLEFNVVYKEWFAIYKLGVKESTYCKIAELFKNHIIPELGRKEIKDITVDNIQKAVLKFYKKTNSYKRLNAYISKVFQFAIKKGYVGIDPTKLVILPKLPPKVNKDNYYNKDEFNQFLDALKGDIFWYTFFRLLGFSGCRRGEILALTWEDINFNDNCININKTLTRGINNKVITSTPKTLSSNREIFLDEETMLILKNWKIKQRTLLDEMNIKINEERQIIFNSSLNTPIVDTRVGKKIKAICKKYNLKYITCHGFRHTNCTMLIEAGLPIKTIQDRLGHSDTRTTLDTYAHINKKNKMSSGDILNDYLKR